MTIAIGALVGLVLGLGGSGGSILAVPLFILFLHLQPLPAIGLALGLVAASALFGVVCQRHSGDIQWRTGLIFAVIGSAFTPLGFAIGSNLDPAVLIICFAALIVVIAILMWKKSNQPAAATQKMGGEDSSFSSQGYWRKTAGITGCAAITGTLSGLFGVGGGFIIVPTLMYLLSITIKQAIATSLLIISLIASAGFASHLNSSHSLPLDLLVEVVCGGIAGMTIGLHIGKMICTAKLQKTFSVIALFMAVVVVNKHFN